MEFDDHQTLSQGDQGDHGDQGDVSLTTGAKADIEFHDHLSIAPSQLSERDISLITEAKSAIDIADPGQALP
jgi:hypothetical protein